MENFIWICKSCNHKWKDENPFQCPKCGHDDIAIFKTPPPRIPLILVAAVVVTIGAILVGYEYWDEIFPSQNVVEIVDEETGVKILKYTIRIVEYDNYFKIKDIDTDKVKLYAINSSTGNRLYSNGDEFYPCENAGDYQIMWDDQENIEISGNTIITNFRLTSPADDDACLSEQLWISDVSVSPNNCKYTIMTNMDDNVDLEVSLKKNGSYTNRKLVWKLNEVNGAKYFYVRISGSDLKTSYLIPRCKIPISANAASASEIIQSFNLYLNDIKNNRKQFTDMIAKFNPIIDYDGEDMDVMQFIIGIRTKVSNDGDSFLSQLSLEENNVIYNSSNTKIIKLKISQ